MPFITEHLLKEKPREINFLFDIETVLLNRNERDIFLMIPSLIGELVDCDYCATIRLSGEDQTLELMTIDGFDGAIEASPLAGTLADLAIRRNDVILIPDIDSDDREINSYPLSAHAKSLLAIPLGFSDVLLGAIVIGSRERAAFSPEDVDLIRLLGRKLSLFVSHLRSIPTSSDYYDPVTRAYRYRVFLDYLRREIQFARRNKLSGSLIHIDIDRFDEINRKYGYKGGDLFLRKIVSVVNRAIRGEDMVSRYAGDEFLLMLPKADKEGAESVARRIRRRLRGELPETSVTMGIASYPDDVDHAETLVSLAVKATEQGKMKGGNRTIQYRGDDIRSLADRLHVKPPLGYAKTNHWDSLSDEFLWLSLTMLSETMQSERASLMILDPKENLLKFEITKNLNEEVRRSVKVKIGEGIAGRALLEGRTILSSDVSSDHYSADRRRDYKSDSFICVPIINDGRKLGVINLTDRRNDSPFTTNERTIIEKFAATIADTLLDRRIDYVEGIGRLCQILEERSDYLVGTSKRVADYSRRIAERMKLPEEKLDYLAQLGFLRELGEIGMDEIIEKSAPLQEEEREKIIRRSEMLGDIFSKVRFLRPYFEARQEHHSRYDQNGISLESRIVAVAEAYVAMTSPRAYRPAMSPDGALRIIREEAGKKYDPTVVNVLTEMVA